MKALFTIITAAVILGGCATVEDKARWAKTDQMVLADPTICANFDLVNDPSPWDEGNYASKNWGGVVPTKAYKDEMSLRYTCRRLTDYQAAERKAAANAAVAGFVLAVAGAALDAHQQNRPRGPRPPKHRPPRGPRPPKHGPRPPKPPPAP